MNFDENGTIGHPALALVSKRTRKTGAGNKRRTVLAGEILAIRLIPLVGGIKSARHDLLVMVEQPGGGWEKNWRIAQGVAINTPEESALAVRQAAARGEGEDELTNLPWFTVDHTTPRRSGYSSFADAQAICDYINRRVGEQIGKSGAEAREALQAEIDGLDQEMVNVFGIHIATTAGSSILFGASGSGKGDKND